MKNYYTQIFVFVFLALGLKTNAQCSSCTTTITGADASNHIINSGTTFCIAPSGTCTGLITVASGGVLCNQGTISSTNLWVAGGTLNNYGTINTSNILASGQGVINNYGSVSMDSLLITNINSSLTNQGSITGIRFGNSDYSSVTNNGSMNVHFIADSSANFTNNSTGFINADTAFANAYNSVLMNYGMFTVNDFYNSYSSTFNNNAYLHILHDFYNSNSSVFTTQCVVPVDHDWYNSATISGPTAGCGGFNVTGLTYNSGIVGAASQHVDICDSGHPAGGIDGNIGTVSSTTTYCSCGNQCNPVGIIDVAHEDPESLFVYPNPAVNMLSFELVNKEAGVLIIEVYDMMGKKKLSDSAKVISGRYKGKVDLSTLISGTYIVSVTKEGKQSLRQIFNVTK